MTFTAPISSMRAGIIGVGFMGSTHARAIRAAGGRVVAAVAATAEGARRAAHATSADEGLASVDQLLSRTDIDVVHICTPNSTHETLSVRALSAGKHIVCEKPIATTSESARRIVDAARAAKRVGTVPFVYRFHPMAREMRARVTRGELGSPSVIHGSYLQDWLASASANNWRVNADAGGASRAFADIGSHWFDLFEFISGDRVARVSARLSTVIAERQGQVDITTEDAASVQFTTERGTLGTVVISQVAAGRKNRLHLELSGTDSSFAFDQESPERLWVGRQDESVDLVRDPAALSPDAARLSFLPSGHPQGYQDAFNAFVTDSYAVMQGSRDEGVPLLASGLRAAELCEAVLTSNERDGAWITAPPPQLPDPTPQQSPRSENPAVARR